MTASFATGAQLAELPPCSDRVHGDKPRQLRARPLRSLLLGQAWDRASEVSHVGELVDAENLEARSQTQELADSPELEFSEFELLDFHRDLRPGRVLRQSLLGSEPAVFAATVWPGRDWTAEALRVSIARTDSKVELVVSPPAAVS